MQGVILWVENEARPFWLNMPRVSLREALPIRRHDSGLLVLVPSTEDLRFALEAAQGRLVRRWIRCCRSRAARRTAKYQQRLRSLWTRHEC